VETRPQGFASMAAAKDVRIGDQDQARRRGGGATEGLGAAREAGRGRQPDREGLGPVRQRRRGPGGGGGGPGGRPRPGGGRPGGRGRGGQSERPRTDENAVSAEGREQPVIEPEVTTTPAPVADAPDTTTPK